MRKFKYIGFSLWLDNLTFRKVYDIINYIERPDHSDLIEIINDLGEFQRCILHDPISDKPLFKEVTLEYRNEIIDGILR